ncbi:type II toxin-antitoxin system MqsA family antitoxin [Pseudomonas sp. MAG002Y]|uniref:type II toxin-antitoxin system MqsA family antitoxin n=1 Tax=Pseudomonas sp. MAG002Y TaxID=2678690 RepID=UPI002155791D|nr:type II toxin-antitoxin system MqsA family antitoxin [Pseudomonas sp. MAG002Y]
MCGQAELVHDTRDTPYSYKGHSTIIKDIKGEYCDACNDCILDNEDGIRLSKTMVAFKKQIDAAGAAVQAPGQTSGTTQQNVRIKD